MKLSKEEREWLRKFNRIFTGRASKAECDELNVSEKTRREFYNDRRRFRQDLAFRPSLDWSNREYEFDESSIPTSSPLDALIEAVDAKKNKKNNSKSSLLLSETPAKPKGRR